MTLPDERHNAVRWARDFLRSLLDPKATPRVPRKVRREARDVLKHFPSDYDMAHIKEAFDAKRLPLGGGHDYTSPRRR